MSKPYPTVEEVIEKLDGAQIGDSGVPLHSILERAIKAACDLDRERGEVETELSVWRRCPWATCAAKDEDGKVFLHEKTAVRRTVFWSSPGRQRVTRALKIHGPWTESLRKRPEGV